MLRLSLLAVPFLAFAAAVPAAASTQDIAPVRAATLPAAVPVAAPDPSVAPYYAAHPGALLWLGTADRRAAAAKLADILRNAPIDGLLDGPALAASVETALAAGTAADDLLISTAWVRYVQALSRPVSGVEYGDRLLQLRPRSASAILGDAAAAPSLAAHLDAVSAVNPLYAALRADAIAQNRRDDPNVLATLDRLRLIPAKGRVIVVDVANAELMLLEGGRTVDTMKVIVGKPTFQTPLLAGTIHYITFNPYWHIPQDVTKRKVAPIVLKRGISYLKAARYQTVAAFGGDKEEPIDPATVDWKAVADGSVEAHIRQLSGPQNMMGKMKFGFVNDQGIFLHDTPHKELFAKAKRTLSLGCVRVEYPQRLATWLMGHEPPALSDDSEQNVRISEGVPIYITYLTARPGGDRISFATDVYKLDAGAASTQAAN